MMTWGLVADEESMDYMKKQRQLPFDKGASEFVPTDMQPANEWQELKETFLFDWPLLETPQVTVHDHRGVLRNRRPDDRLTFRVRCSSPRK